MQTVSWSPHGEDCAKAAQSQSRFTAARINCGNMRILSAWFVIFQNELDSCVLVHKSQRQGSRRCMHARGGFI